VVAVTSRSEGQRAAVAARFPGWRILHTSRDLSVHCIDIPGGCFYAVNDRLSEPPLMAPGLGELADLVEHRYREIEAVKEWAMRSDLRNILPRIERRT
jgi:hypothetical protein